MEAILWFSCEPNDHVGKIPLQFLSFKIHVIPSIKREPNKHCIIALLSTKKLSLTQHIYTMCKIHRRRKKVENRFLLR
jgi:hypothetical protein